MKAHRLKQHTPTFENEREAETADGLRAVGVGLHNRGELGPYSPIRPMKKKRCWRSSRTRRTEHTVVTVPEPVVGGLLPKGAADAMALSQGKPAADDKGDQKRRCAAAPDRGGWRLAGVCPSSAEWRFLSPSFTPANRRYLLRTTFWRRDAPAFRVPARVSSTSIDELSATF